MSEQTEVSFDAALMMRQMKEPVLQDPVQQSSSFMVLQEVVVGRR